MTRIKLDNYGEINIKEGTNLPLNYNVSNLKKPFSTPSSYSKDIEIIGDDITNEILSYAFNVNINGKFDNTKKVSCQVLQDDNIVFDTSYFQLVSVRIDKEGRYIYTGRIISDLMDFFTIIKGRDLTDLNVYDQSTYMLLTKSNIENTFTNTYINKFKMVPMMKLTNPTKMRAKDWTPGIYAWSLWDQIHTESGYSFEMESDIEEKFKELVIPYTGEYDADEETKSLSSIEAQQTTFQQYDFLCRDRFYSNGFTGNFQTPVIGGGNNSKKYISVDTEIKDNFNQYENSVSYGNVTTPEITAAFTCDYEYTYTIDYDLVFTNNDPDDIYLDGESGSQLVISYYTRSQVYDQNSQNAVSGPHLSNIGFQVTFNEGQVLPPGNTTISGEATFTTTVPMNKDEVIRLIQFYEDWSAVGNDNQDMVWRPAGSTAASRSVCRILNVNSIDLTVTPSLEYNSGTPIYLQQFLPREVSQREFIKSFLTMFNLITYIDPQNDNNIVYKTRDTYYDEGREVNWTDKLKYDRGIDLQWLITDQPQKQDFSYKPDEDILNSGYENNIKKVYGEKTFDFKSEFNVSTSKEEIIFSPTPIYRHQESNMYVPGIPISEYTDLNIRVLIDGGIRQAYWFFQNDDGTYDLTNNSNYPYFGHFNDPENPSWDINFDQCDYYYYNSWTLTRNNLFNSYHRRKFNQLKDGRIMTAYFNLTPLDLKTLELNQRILIENDNMGQTMWNINRIIDYNANSNGLTKVELITVDDGVSVDVDRFIKPFRPLPSKPSISRPILEGSNGESSINNTINHGFQGGVHGVGNTVNGKSYTIGDNNVNNGNNKSIIVGDNNSNNFDGKLVIGNKIETDQYYDGFIGDVKIGRHININETIFKDNGIDFKGLYMEEDYVVDGYVYESEMVTEMIPDGSGGTEYNMTPDKLIVSASEINFSNLPTSSAGLDPGTLWNDAGTVKIA